MRTEPDGSTRIAYIPDLGGAFGHAVRAARVLEEAAANEAFFARLAELGQAPTFDIALPEAKPKNWRPWHKHTLPSRRRR